MSVKKISELTEISKKQLKQFKRVLLELVVEKDGGYRSVYIPLNDIGRIIINNFGEEGVDDLIIDKLLKVENGDVIFNLDSEDAGKRKFIGKFGDIQLYAIGDDTGKIYLYAQNGIELDSSPVIITKHLYVYNTSMQTVKKSILKNRNNVICVSNVNPDDYTIINKKLLADTIGGN